MKNPSQYLFELNVRSNEIKERNIARNGHLTSTACSIRRNTLAGLPTTIVFVGTSFVTTLPAPTMAFSPTLTRERIVAPEPIDAPFLTTVRSTFQSASVCSCPYAVVARG